MKNLFRDGAYLIQHKTEGAIKCRLTWKDPQKGIFIGHMTTGDQRMKIQDVIELKSIKEN